MVNKKGDKGSFEKQVQLQKSGLEIHFDTKSRSRKISDALKIARLHKFTYKGSICIVNFDKISDDDIVRLLKLIHKLKSTKVLADGKDYNPRGVLNTLDCKYQISCNGICQHGDMPSFELFCNEILRGIIPRTGHSYKKFKKTLKIGNNVITKKRLLEFFTSVKKFEADFCVKFIVKHEFDMKFKLLPDEVILKTVGVRGELIEVENRMLDLWNKGIEKISAIEGLQNLRDLQALDLNHNRISEIEGLELLVNLEKLNLAVNQIKELRGLETLTCLRELYLDRNQIEELTGIDTLVKLEKLYLRNNRIKTIPSFIGGLTNLKYLILTDNPLRAVPDFLESRTDLTFFDEDTSSRSTHPLPYSFKVVLIGAKGVGISSFINAFADRTFDQDYRSTIGTNIARVDIRYKDYLIALALWNVKKNLKKETAVMFLSGAQFILIFFDLTNNDSLSKALESLDLTMSVSPNSMVALIGNKVDLIEQRILSPKTIREYLQRIKSKYSLKFLPYFEISAVTRRHLELIKILLIAMMLSTTSSFKKEEVEKGIRLFQDLLKILEDELVSLPESHAKYQSRAEYADIADFLLTFLMDNLPSSPYLLEELVGELEYSKCREVTDYLSKYIVNVDDNVRDLADRLAKIPKGSQDYKFIQRVIYTLNPKMINLYPSRVARKEILNNSLDILRKEENWCLLEFVLAGFDLGIVFIDYKGDFGFYSLEDQHSGKYYKKNGRIRRRNDAEYTAHKVRKLEDKMRFLLQTLSFAHINLQKAIWYFEVFKEEDKARTSLSTAEDFLKKYSKNLYELIPEPIQKKLKRNTYDHLIIIPHKQLNAFIWELAFDGEEYWGLKYSISRNFSLDLLKLILMKSQKFVASENTFSSLFIGDPNYKQYKLESIVKNRKKEVHRIPLELPGAEEEITLIMKELAEISRKIRKTSPVVILKANATKKKFVDALRTEFDLIHFAGHGVWTGENPDQSYLIFHNDQDDIEEFGTEIKLTSAELASIQFRKPLILVFSACESGKSEIFGGDEFFGLIRGAMLAGATSIVLSNWVVFDESTRDLMVTFYSQLFKGKSIGIALRNARRKLYRNAQMGKYRYKESRIIEILHWASFTIFGDPFRDLTSFFNNDHLL